MYGDQFGEFVRGYWGLKAKSLYLATNKDSFGIKTVIANLIECSSCKTSSNVLSPSHWGLGQFFGGGEV